jgi:calcineurin-like phosphoesterase family protein/purple acid phosphatase-like protein
MRSTLRVSSIIVLLFGALLYCHPNVDTVTRGPYLQTGTDAAITVRWRTAVKTDSVVRYGHRPDNLTQTVIVHTDNTEHEVRITGLKPLTRYYYSIGNSSKTLAGGNNSYRFTTSPTPGIATPTRVWLIGDSGTADDAAATVYRAYLNYPGSENTNLWIMLGDNAYNYGTDRQYQSAVFNMYPELLRRTPLWPTLGNHDGRSADSDSESGPYYNIFSLPRNAEAGGLASGTEAYYSFDYGNVHFICLDSYETDRTPDGAMMNWLKNDLAATDEKWIIAFWHHPPYSKGSHDSDAEIELIDMRQYALPILESYGVDLVFAGHSHSYERSFLIDSHYGLSGTFNASHLIDKGDGRENGNGAYHKDNHVPHAGAVYTVAGASGKTTGGTLDHPAMFVSLNQLGSVVLDINNDRLDAKYLGTDGIISDYFTVIKGQDSFPATVLN